MGNSPCARKWVFIPKGHIVVKVNQNPGGKSAFGRGLWKGAPPHNIQRGNGHIGNHSPGGGFPQKGWPLVFKPPGGTLLSRILCGTPPGRDNLPA